MSLRLAKNFVVQEFVPPEIMNNKRLHPCWFIDDRLPVLAQFYKEFFRYYYRKKYGEAKVRDVLIVINNWHTGGSMRYRGFRPFEYIKKQLRNNPKTATLSQHTLGQAFDCDIIIVFADGKKLEADYNEVYRVIVRNYKQFMQAGLTTIERFSDAPTWLHSDMRWTGLDGILVVGISDSEEVGPSAGSGTAPDNKGT